jgi:hypothetical protein
LHLLRYRYPVHAIITAHKDRQPRQMHSHVETGAAGYPGWFAGQRLSHPFH